MLLFAGLGNPGADYARNRHNIGFMAVDAIAERHGFGPWKSRFQGQISEGRLGTEKVLLLKPMTYMNESGRSVGEALRFFKLTEADMLIFHDELDLAPGRIRLKSGGGHAGHNGLRSIHAHCSPDYRRLRLGIGHPGHKDAVRGYVLKDFSKADQDWLGSLLDAIARHAELLVRKPEGSGDTDFMSKVAMDSPVPKGDKAGT